MRVGWVCLALASVLCYGCRVEVRATEGPRRPAHREAADHGQRQVERATGLIEIYAGNPDVYLVLDWKSRSRKSYTVLNADEFNLRRLNGKIIRVEGEFSKTSPFSGTVKIRRVLSEREH